VIRGLVGIGTKDDAQGIARHVTRFLHRGDVATSLRLEREKYRD